MIPKQQIEQARQRIRPYILETPLMHSKWLSETCRGNVYLKLESEQMTGSFKARGSLYKLITLTEHKDDLYPVTVSSGNHALGFARAVELLDLKGKVFVPLNVDPSKLKAIKQFDVQVEQYGAHYDETEAYVLSEASKNDWAYVSPYNDEQVIAGQGTIAAEITEQLPSPDSILATVGGGGLISGIGSYMHHVSPQTKMIGCQPENSPEMSVAVRKGSYRSVQTKPTLSDGSAGGFEDGAITLPMCKQLVNEFILISEEDIKRAIRGMVDHHHKLIEGAAGVTIASLLKQPQRFAGQTTVIVVCGANISSQKLKEVLE